MALVRQSDYRGRAVTTVELPRCHYAGAVTAVQLPRAEKKVFHLVGLARVIRMPRHLAASEPDVVNYNKAEVHSGSTGLNYD